MATAGVRLGRYDHPRGDCMEFWYECESRKCEVHLFFAQPARSIREIDKALKYACEQNATGVTVTRSNTNAGLVFCIRGFKPYKPGFNSLRCSIHHNRAKCLNIKCIVSKISTKNKYKSKD